MRLGDHLTAQSVSASLRAADKEGLLQEVASLLAAGSALDPEKITHTLRERELVATTGIGSGVAIPHGRLPDAEEIRICLGVHPEGVEFDALDGKRVHIFFGVLAPADEPGVHLKALARISRLVRSESLRHQLRSAESPAALIEVLADAEAGIL